MKRSTRSATPAVPIIIALLFQVLSGTSHGAQHRSLAEFLDAQGTFFAFFPPVPDYIGWVTQTSAGETTFRFTLIDYAGLAAESIVAQGGPPLPTTTTGSVTEPPLTDGRALVTVALHTTNALIWVAEFDLSDPSCCDLVNQPLLFGARAQDLVDDPTRAPALADTHIQAVFTIANPGDPLPDIVCFFEMGGCPVGVELISLKLRATGAGPLHAEFGVPEGTPGKAVVTQISPRGLDPTQLHGHQTDSFPVEKIDLHVIGH